MDKNKRRLTFFNFFTFPAGIGILIGLSALESSHSYSDNPLSFLDGFYILLYGIPVITLIWFIWMIITIKTNFGDRSYRYWNLSILASPILLWLLFVMIHLSLANSYKQALENPYPVSTDISKSPFPALAKNWLCTTSGTKGLSWESIFFESDSVLQYSGVTFNYKYTDSIVYAVSREDSLQFIFKIKSFTPKELIIEEQINTYGSVGRTFPCDVVLLKEEN